MLIAEQSLAETLDGRADDRRRRCRLFIPHQAVFIPNKLLFSPRLVFSHPPDRRDGCHPVAGVKGITVERSSNRVGVAAPWRPAMLATGIIGGIADCAPAGAADMAGVPPMCIAVPAVAIGGAAAVHADGTDNAPALVA
jgi:hypothetical protein